MTAPNFSFNIEQTCATIKPYKLQNDTHFVKELPSNGANFMVSLLRVRQLHHGHDHLPQLPEIRDIRIDHVSGTVFSA